jgi:phosphatidylserine/phosphatidylglycerophosphate/cardiolipin synthase-like enzyme
VETVWSGPGSPHVPVRATAAVLADVVREARRELLLMTCSARRYQPLAAALQAAVGRGVQVSVVVETLHGAGSALGGDEPYQAFTPVDGIALWHWPTAKRTEAGAKMRATSRQACSSAVAQPRPAPPNMSMPCEQAVT